MSRIKIYQVDAFTSDLFTGNPAAVCPLENWLPDELMQSIALENNLSETAFFINKENKLFIRWFTPKVEIDLCGHATLATAHVLFSEMNIKDNQVVNYVLFCDENYMINGFDRHSLKNQKSFFS